MTLALRSVKGAYLAPPLRYRGGPQKFKFSIFDESGQLLPEARLIRKGEALYADAEGPSERRPTSRIKAVVTARVSPDGLPR